MKLSACASLLLFAGDYSASAFSIAPPMATSRRSCAAKTSSIQKISSSSLSSSKDEYDDWYADFDPSEFEAPKKTSYYDDDGDDGYTSSRGGRGGGGSWGGGGRRGGGGRGGGRGHGYRRDTSQDHSKVDLEAVDSLLEARNAARRSREYDEADNIRDELLKVHGVRVFDKDREWRSGCSESGSGMGRRGGGRSSFGGRPSRAPQDFGPNGHDYDLASDSAPNTSPLSEEEIHTLIAERLQCKLSRNFRRADQIQNDLASDGVYVHDGLKLWRADGELFGQDMDSGKVGRQRGSRNDRNRPYTQSDHSSSEDWSTEQTTLIQEMIERRSAAKISRDYDTADSIRDELRNEHNVFLDDRLREWSVGGDFGPDAPGANAKRNREFQRSSASLAPDTPEMEQEIENLLKERTEARKIRDFESADGIRNRLEQEYRVLVNDRVGEWWIADDGGRNERSAPSNERQEEEELSGDGWELVDEEQEVAIEDEMVVMEEEEEEEATAEEDEATDEKVEPVAAEEEPTEGEVDLTTLTVVQLKEKLKEAGLPVSGRKDELIARLS